MNVFVLFGGQSTEYEVSCLSAFHVITNINGHNITKIGITKEGRWFFTEASDTEIKDCMWDTSDNIIRGKNISVEINLSEKSFSKNGKIVPCDVIFPVLHGKNGEDGTIQGFLELMGIPYVGSKVLASALCMDKAYANRIFEKEGLRHVKWLSIDKADYLRDKEKIHKDIREAFSFPVFVKPSNAGSSVGITKCSIEKELENAFETALEVDNRIIIEEGLNNPKEIEIAVMGNSEPFAALPGRVMSATEVYDYESKYKNSSSYNQIPAEIDRRISDIIRDMAIKAYKACSCACLARVDFFVDDNNEIYINEINTLPGFTSISMYPQAFKKSGTGYSEQIEKLLGYALSD